VFEIIRKGYVVDVAIVGSGLAGLSTTYFLDTFMSERVVVAIISKSSLGYGTSTYYSAGAFRCPVNGYSVDDYVRDVVEGGRYINKRSLVELIALRSVDAIRSLERLGIRFRASRGTLRVVSDDPLFRGRELVLALKDYVVKRPNTVVLENTYMLDIVKCGDGTFNTICITTNGDYVVITSKVVVLATGGAANVYVRSDNPQQLSCDGHGVCLRLGLPLIDMEFIQFFPLGIAEPGRPTFMIPFTKGRLVNKLGEDIIVKYGLGSLGKAIIVNRDRLSRYMMLEVMKGDGVDGTLLIYPEESDEELSSFANELRRRLGLRPPIKVLPTAHFSMGGVEVGDDLETSINGLYVVGELVGGIHGANRLGGNALTSCVVTAEVVARNITDYIENRFRGDVRLSDEGVNQVVNEYRLREGKYIPSEVRSRIRNLMWSKAGIIRSNDSLKECIDELLIIHEELDKVRIGSHEEVIKYSEMLNTLLTSITTTYSALLRRESRGAHFRLDYPEEDSSWVKNIRITYSNGKFNYEICEK
jgi:succinate dehydrogenase/fumarate reductase flavoprotein subunit